MQQCMHTSSSKRDMHQLDIPHNTLGEVKGKHTGSWRGNLPTPHTPHQTAPTCATALWVSPFSWEHSVLSSPERLHRSPHCGTALWSPVWPCACDPPGLPVSVGVGELCSRCSRSCCSHSLHWRAACAGLPAGACGAKGLWMERCETTISAPGNLPCPGGAPVQQAVGQHGVSGGRPSICHSLFSFWSYSFAWSCQLDSLVKLCPLKPHKAACFRCDMSRMQVCTCL